MKKNLLWSVIIPFGVALIFPASSVSLTTTLFHAGELDNHATNEFRAIREKGRTRLNSGFGVDDRWYKIASNTWQGFGESRGAFVREYNRWKDGRRSWAGISDYIVESLSGAPLPDSKTVLLVCAGLVGFVYIRRRRSGLKKPNDPEPTRTYRY